MRVLIGGAPSKIFHLKEFVDALSRINIDAKLVIDTDVKDGFPSRKISNWFQSRGKFQKLISDFKPDVVLIDRPSSHFGLAVIKEGLPLIIQLRGDYWSEIKWARQTLYRGMIMRLVLWYKNKIAEKCFKKSKIILPICNYLKNIVDEKHSDKSGVFYQGIDPKRWYPTKGLVLKHPCVGLLQGATIWGKTKEMLVLEKILKDMPNVTFYWVGDGPYAKKILSVLEKYDNFKWLGQLEYPDKVRDYLTEIDIYALVSGIDMSPLTLQEAQLMKKPVVATNVGGIPELMKNNETGFLIDKGDSKKWIEKLSLLVKDNEKRDMMGNAGRKFIEDNFNWYKIATEFINILKKYGIT